MYVMFVGSATLSYLGGDRIIDMSFVNSSV